MCTGNETLLEEIRLCILTSPHYFFSVEVFYGLLSVICFLGGTFGNIIAFVYFLHQRKDNSNIIYMLITSVDVIISVTQLPVGFSYLDQRRAGVFGNTVFCNVWHFFWQIMSRQSVALVAILSITRTLSILFPLKIRISRRSILLSLILTFFLQTFTGTIMYWFGGSGIYTPGNVDCSYLDIDHTYYYYHVVPTIIWYWLPVLPVIASCFISLRVLKNSKRPLCKWQKVEKRQSQATLHLNKSKDNATMTIVLLTTLYVIFNIPMCMFNIFWMIDDMKKESDADAPGFFDFDNPTYYVNNLVYCLCVPLNSLANPVLYLCRIKRLRTALVGKTLRIFGSSSNTHGVQLASIVQPHHLIQGESGSRPSVSRHACRNVPMNRSPSTGRFNKSPTSERVSRVNRNDSLGVVIPASPVTIRYISGSPRYNNRCKRLSVPTEVRS